MDIILLSGGADENLSFKLPTPLGSWKLGFYFLYLFYGTILYSSWACYGCR